MGFAIFLAWSSLLAIFLFFIKKIHYRGEVTLSTMSASIRQAIFIVIGGIMTGLLYSLQIAEPKLIMMVWAAVACLEILIQTLE